MQSPTDPSHVELCRLYFVERSLSLIGKESERLLVQLVLPSDINESNEGNYCRANKTRTYAANIDNGPLRFHVCWR